MNDRQRDNVEPLIDLTGWNTPPERIASLPGQRSLFDSPAPTPAPPSDPPPDELFETGRDLPGAAETDQSLLWDVQ